MDKAHFSIISDVHQKYDEYFPICSKFENTLQLGDMGFDYRPLVANLDPTKHRFFGGNHDAYHTTPSEFWKEDDVYVQDPSNHFVVKDMVYEMKKFPQHSLGQWGTWQVPDATPTNLSGNIFFVRGAWSMEY